jgi:hypothetical protein
MDAFPCADREAEALYQGILLGATHAAHERLEAQLHAANDPVTVRDLEALTRPDIDPTDYSEPMDCERVSMARLYAPDQTSDGWALAAAWFGWLPGRYDTRDAALTAYGYVLVGEAPGALEYLRNRVQGVERRLITVDDLKAYASGVLAGTE